MCWRTSRRAIDGKLTGVDNRDIADRLDAFAAVLELGEANPYTARAYRRAADTIRGAALPVADLVRAGRVRQLRGIGPGIESRLRELIDTGQIAELAELERELAPDLVGLGRYLGLSAKRSIELARALDVRTLDELREAAADRAFGDRARDRAEDRGAPARGARRRRRPETPRGTAAESRAGAGRRDRGGARRRGRRGRAPLARFLRAAGRGVCRGGRSGRRARRASRSCPRSSG